MTTIIHKATKAADHSERAHAILSPSRSKQWMNCPASAYWTSTLPERPAGPDAEWGTKAHEYAEKALRLVVDNKSASKVLDSIPDAAMRDIVEGYVVFCTKVLVKVRRLNPTMMRVYVEERVRLSDHVWGTCDFAIAFEVNGFFYVTIVDLKTGAGVPVYVEGNTQFQIYAEGVARLHERRPDRVWAYNYQPRCFDEPQRAVYSGEEFDGNIAEIEARATSAFKIIQDKNEPGDYAYNAGEHCRFCVIEGDCPARKNRFKKAGIALMKQAAFPSVQLLTMEQKLKILSVKSECEDFLSAIEHSLLTDLSRGKKVPGYKLVRGRAYRKWIEDEKRVGAALKKAGIKAYRQDLINLGEAERQLKKVGKESLLTKLTTKGEGKLQIAREDDAREKVSSKAIELIKEGNGNRKNKQRGNGKVASSRKTKGRGK